MSSDQKYFPQRPDISPSIYVYTLPHDTTKDGRLKVGYTTRDPQARIDEQTKTAGVSYQLLLVQDAIRSDGSTFKDHDIHRYLRQQGIHNPEGEWFVCTIDEIRKALYAITHRTENEEGRTLDFAMRPEQEAAVRKTAQYFGQHKESNHASHFLRNAKMRFGKTFAAYQLALRMGWKRLLVLTFKPAVENARYEDLMRHKDFTGWQFISKNTKSYHDRDITKPFVCFGSLQDFLGTNAAGGIKAKNERVHEINRDVIIFDEYHFGAWRDNAKELVGVDGDDQDLYDIKAIEQETKNETDPIARTAFEEGVQQAEESIPITTDHYLYLSGTPFRAIGAGEFIEDQIFNWTYSDEQSAKTARDDTTQGPNPYAMLPQMIMMTYQMPDSIKHIAQGGEYDEFDLNVFFGAEGEGDDASFVYKEYVQKRLDLIRGSYLETSLDNLKLGAKKPVFPFSDVRLIRLLTHTFWFLPSVASCYAMKNLLHERQNTFYHDYRVIVAAGTKAGQGVKALDPVLHAMGNPLETKTITLSTGKLTTGVSVKPWSGVLMLRNLNSPETYFQTAFRGQTPWVIDNPNGLSPHQKEIMKHTCYIFDFAPTRALNQVADYSSKLNPSETNPEKKVADFIKFLPVLAYDGSSMKEIDAGGILDIVTSGTTATLLARRWESALLVNVDNETLARLMASEEAMDALMSIEGFRSLNQDIEIIINKSESVKKTKQEQGDEKLSKKEKKEMTDAEKEYKSTRKKIQQNLIKFATRIPVFMYLTDYREHTLKDVITQLEPGLFKKVTGLTVKDFELLVSLNVFNDSLMNDAVYKFRRYEDSSLAYTGINKHVGKNVGGFSTVFSADQHDKI